MADIIDIPGIVTLNEIEVSVIALLIVSLVLIFFKWHVQSKRAKSLQKMVGVMDTEKAEMYSKLKSFEDENSSLNEKFKKMEKDYSEKMQVVGEKEGALDENSKAVKSKLLEIKGMEDTIDMHRVKIGRLEIEKSDLERRLESATKDIDKKMSREKEKLKSHAKELKEKTQEAVEVLKKENEAFKKKYQKVKERLGLWESVKDL